MDEQERSSCHKKIICGFPGRLQIYKGVDKAIACLALRAGVLSNRHFGHNPPMSAADDYFASHRRGSLGLAPQATPSGSSVWTSKGEQISFDRASIGLLTPHLFATAGCLRLVETPLAPAAAKQVLL